MNHQQKNPSNKSQNRQKQRIHKIVNICFVFSTTLCSPPRFRQPIRKLFKNPPNPFLPAHSLPNYLLHLLQHRSPLPLHSLCHRLNLSFLSLRRKTLLQLLKENIGV